MTASHLFLSLKFVQDPDGASIVQSERPVRLREAMRSFFYHLKFELYPTSSPATGGTTRTKGKAQAAPSPPNKDLWLPLKGADIFAELPAHSKKTSKKPNPSYRPQPSPLQSFEPPYPADTYRASTLRVPTESPSPNLIDCGPSRAPVKEDSGSNIERISERQWRARTQSFPLRLLRLRSGQRRPSGTGVLGR
ncbi:hypothetical protein ColLi_12571 [Colletotrichum liriopes]|uniref:Uncharacterized protein n=1 Tax=Colletotrichum liriopes TaxID=708192 RepID=A0AA37GYM3_9PEZI|nr:hypothetical protein ColLi_12571 [Colletotrichum liriopes]